MGAVRSPGTREERRADILAYLSGDPQTGGALTPISPEREQALLAELDEMERHLHAQGMER